MTPAVALAIPCRVDEPALGRTVTGLWTRLEEAGAADAPTLVCLNGADPEGSRAWDDLRRAAAEVGRMAQLREATVDAAVAPSEVVALATQIGRAHV